MDAGLDSNILEFNRRMQDKVDKLGMAGPIVVKQEAGNLARTLVQISPPSSLSTARKAIQGRVNSTFATLSESRESNKDKGGDSGKNKVGGDVWWYAFQPDAIFGLEKEKDMTGATVDDLLRLYQQTKIKFGRVVAGRRGKQTVYIEKRITTKKSTVEKLIRRIQGHIGRLKAAWVVSWQDCGSPSGTLGPVPQWVTKHASGSRALGKGFSVDGLGIPGNPTFTIVNRSKGTTEIRKQGLLSAALKIRAKAMAADYRLYIRGVKKV